MKPVERPRVMTEQETRVRAAQRTWCQCVKCTCRGSALQLRGGRAAGGGEEVSVLGGARLSPPLPSPPLPSPLPAGLSGGWMRADLAQAVLALPGPLPLLTQPLRMSSLHVGRGVTGLDGAAHICAVPL